MPKPRKMKGKTVYVDWNKDVPVIVKQVKKNKLFKKIRKELE